MNKIKVLDIDRRTGLLIGKPFEKSEVEIGKVFDYRIPMKTSNVSVSLKLI